MPETYCSKCGKALCEHSPEASLQAQLREVTEERDSAQEAVARQNDQWKAMYANLEAERDAAIEQVEGMQREGCAAIGLVENIFNGLTLRGVPDDPTLREMADACAALLVEATQCDHKERAEAQEESDG